MQKHARRHNFALMIIYICVFRQACPLRIDIISTILHVRTPYSCTVYKAVRSGGAAGAVAPPRNFQRKKKTHFLIVV